MRRACCSVVTLRGATSLPAAVFSARFQSVSQPSPSTSTEESPSAAAATTNKAGSSKSQSQHHKLSSNVGDAGFIGEDVPFSLMSNLGYKALHARRLLLPVFVGTAAFTLLPVTAGVMEYVTLGCAMAVIQRLSVRGATNAIKKDLTGHVCVVTGGTSGLGLATVCQLLDMGATVCVVALPGKEKEATEYIHQNVAVVDPSLIEARLSFIPADFSDQAEVAAAAQKIIRRFPTSIDILVNCAGVVSEEPKLTKQGLEEHIAVNFLSPFLLTESLLPSLRKSKVGGRVVYVTCSAHHGVRKGNVVRDRMNLKPSPEESQLTARCYSASKLGNIYHSQWLASRRYEGISFTNNSGGGNKNKSTTSSTTTGSNSEARPISVCTVDPGVTATNIDQNNEPLLGRGVVGRLLRSMWCKDPLEGSQTIIKCCVADDLENGGHYAECRVMPSGLSRMANSPREMNEVCKWASSKVEKYLTMVKGGV